MTNPVTPPPELVQQWIEQGVSRPPGTDYMTCFATQAAQYGADQELEAIQKEIITQAWFADPGHRLAQLRAARRPKPPSLKERALQAWAAVETGTDDQTAMAVIRRALEALPND
jgi:hypothetical protein